jgi:hypothetical protein
VSDLPARPALDRVALERVLARAAELQGQSSTADATGALSDAQILELGKEVGLSPETLRQAIAEERARVAIPEARGVAGWFGPETFAATRVVPGTPESALIAIDAVLRGDLPFDVKRRFPDRVHWEPRRGFFDAVRSQFIRGVEGADLRLAQEIATTVTAIDQGRTHVRIDAVLTESRRRAVAASRNTLVVGAVTGTVLTALAGFGAVFVVPPIAIAAGGMLFSFRRGYRNTATRVLTAIEQILDRLEFGPAKKRGAGLPGSSPA